MKGGEEEEATLEPSEERCIEVRRRFSSRGLPRSTIGFKICEITISSTVLEILQPSSFERKVHFNTERVLFVLLTVSSSFSLQFPFPSAFSLLRVSQSNTQQTKEHSRVDRLSAVGEKECEEKA